MLKKIRALIAQLSDVRHKLAEHDIRDTSDYAEVLVARALRGRRENYINKGFDVLTKSYGRVEVKSRCLPEDGRQEERVEIGRGKTEGFDYLAIVIFLHDYRVKYGVLVPYEHVWSMISVRRYRRLSYMQARLFPGALDITKKLKAVEDK